MKKIVINLTLLATIAIADISISPAPISSDNIKNEGTEQRINASYMNYSGDNIDFLGLGIGYGKRTRSANKKVTDWSISYTNLSGDTGIYDIEGYNLSLTYMFGRELSNKNSIIYVGPIYTYTKLGQTVPMGTQLSEGHDIWSYTTMYGLQAGIQYKLYTSFGSFSPWCFATYLVGETEMESYALTTTSSTADIDPLLMTSFGFDMYFKDLGASLSTMYKKDEDSDMINFSYSYKF